MDTKCCPHCKRELESEREQFIGCCYVCRRYGLLLGTWPEKIGDEQMLKDFSDEQIATLLKLCGEIAAVRECLPAAPRGYERQVSLEIAKNVRNILEQHTDTLAALRDLLALAS